MPHQPKVARAGTNGTPITDGVFPEAKEFMLGYWIVESPERAYEIAAGISAGPGPGGVPTNMPIEVREIVSLRRVKYAERLVIGRATRAFAARTATPGARCRRASMISPLYDLLKRMFDNPAELSHRASPPPRRNHAMHGWGALTRAYLRPDHAQFARQQSP
jgi:hypothetical protein